MRRSTGVLDQKLCAPQYPTPQKAVGASQAGRSLTEKKKCSRTSFPKKARGHSMCSTMVGDSWRLAAVGGRQLAVGGSWWWLAAVGGW